MRGRQRRGITAPPPPPPPEWTRPQLAVKPERSVPVWRIAFFCTLLTIAIVLFGFFHVIFGGARTITVCSKEEWGLGNTFMTVDGAMREFVGNLRVQKALTRCAENR
ncbi:MAG: hypothetical protein ABI867_41410 [Kofleriaceae bacterium]